MNPFIIKEIPIDASFCNRKKEMADLINYAKSNQNVVLYSPRRFGKTSLVKRVQHELERKKFLTAYCDLFGVTSVEEIAGRITNAIYAITRKNESLFKKAIQFLTSFRPVLSPSEDGNFTVSVQPAFKEGGIQILENTMISLKQFIGDIPVSVNVVIDEFQELTEVTNSITIEGVLRTHIQNTHASFFFVGSRRRVLLDMFSDRKRPFYQSAFLYQLGPLPKAELADFIVDQFKKKIKKEDVLKICESFSAHPYYVQKYCYFLFEKGSVNDKSLSESYTDLLEGERVAFENILQGLKVNQIVMLAAIAKEPAPNIFSAKYMKRHNLGSIGGIQNNIEILANRDLIEKDKSLGWIIVDPLFAIWLKKQYS